jgi:hypothetical protein
MGPSLSSEDSVKATKISGNSPISLKSIKDHPPVLVDTEVGVVHVGLGEHEAFTRNTDRRHPLPGCDREQAVRLTQITC